MPVDLALEFLHDGSSSALGIGPIADHRKSIDAFAVDQDIESHQIGRLVPQQFIIHRPIAARGTLEFVVQVVDHFGQRQVVRQHGARRRKVLRPPRYSAAFLAQFHHRANIFGRDDEVNSHDRLPEFGDLSRVGHFLRPMDLLHFTAARGDLIGDVGSGLDEVEVGLLFEPLLDDLHVEQSEKPAAEPESQRIARLRYELETRIVDREFLEGIPQFGEVLTVGRIEAAVDHALRRLITGQGWSFVVGREHHRVADVHVGDRLDVADDVAYLSGRKCVTRFLFGAKPSEFQHFVDSVGAAVADLVASRQAPLSQADIRDGASVGIVMRVEDHRLQGSVRVAFGSGNALQDGFEEPVDADPCFGADGDHFFGIDPERVFHLLDDLLHTSVLQVDLVDDRNDRQVMLHRRIRIGHRLGFHALVGIDDQQSSFAAGERPGNFVLEVDVSRCVDQIEFVFDAVPNIGHGYGASFDRDASSPFQLHVIEQLVLHLSRSDRSRVFEQPVGQRALAMVDMSDDAEVAYPCSVHAVIVSFPKTCCPLGRGTAWMSILASPAVRPRTAHDVVASSVARA